MRIPCRSRHDGSIRRRVLAKRIGIVHAQVPSLATQARIRYRQFLFKAGNGIADTQVRIMGEGKGKKKYVAVLVSVYSGQKDLE